MGIQARARNVDIRPHGTECRSQEGRVEEGRRKESRIKEVCVEEVWVEDVAHLIVASCRSLTVAGAIVLVLVLVGFPVIVGLGSVVLAALLGTSLDRDAVKRHAGSELLDLNR